MQVRNNITLIGNLGGAPILTTLASGTQVAEFRLATNDYFKDRDGNRQERTEWHRVKAFGKLAETFGKYLERGSQVCVAGALRYSKWIDKHDQVRITAEIIASEFTFLSPGKVQPEEDKSAALETGKESKPKAKRSTKKQAPKAKVQEVPEDVVPF
ncbi:MAG: single-stranded DNA-binding protein [Bacteroidota bacterium]